MQSDIQKEAFHKGSLHLGSLWLIWGDALESNSGRFVGTVNVFFFVIFPLPGILGQEGGAGE